MRLLFNATNLRSEGGVILLRHLLKAILTELQPGCEILLYLNPELAPRISDITSEYTNRLTLTAFRPQGTLGRFLWEQVTLPGLVRKHNVDTLFSFGNTGPLFPGCRQILYLQQSIPYTDYLPPGHRLKWLFFQRLYGFLIGLAQLGSRRIVVPTGWLVAPVRASIGNAKPLSAYVVSMPGLPELPSLESNGLLASHEIALLERLEQWQASDIRILLYPCYLAPYKNIPWLLEAVAELEKRNPPAFRLLLTFDRESREYFPCRAEVFRALETAASPNIVLTGSLSRQAIAEVYRRADILTYPSLVETLGLPLVEAMSAGLPVVALASSKPHARQAAFAREICADGALYTEPDNPSAFAEHLECLLRDPMRAFEIGQKGRQRASLLSWQRHIGDIFPEQVVVPK